MSPSAHRARPSARGAPRRRAVASSSDERALAQRTLDVKCFLNARTCRHNLRGRRWTCTVSTTFESVRCVTGERRVSWRNPS